MWINHLKTVQKNAIIKWIVSTNGERRKICKASNH